jgi:alpha-tubulin suppressor-like RCC1 family protein
VGVGDLHSCALLGNAGARQVRCWGDGASGKLGHNSTSDSATPVQVQGLPADLVELTVGAWHGCARSTAGNVFCWGENNNGRLGLGHQSDRSTAQPVSVGGVPMTATSISAGEEHTCAVQAGGALCWGRNQAGQLGDGTLSQKLVPTPVPGLSGVQSISAGVDHTFAVRTDAGERELVCWGNNSQGELGTGTLSSSASPVEVAGSSCEFF